MEIFRRLPLELQYYVYEIYLELWWNLNSEKVRWKHYTHYKFVLDEFMDRFPYQYDPLIRILYWDNGIDTTSVLKPHPREYFSRHGNHRRTFHSKYSKMLDAKRRNLIQKEIRYRDDL